MILQIDETILKDDLANLLVDYSAQGKALHDKMGSRKYVRHGRKALFKWMDENIHKLIEKYK